jgi:hypothetical protein
VYSTSLEGLRKKEEKENTIRGRATEENKIAHSVEWIPSARGYESSKSEVRWNGKNEEARGGVLTNGGELSLP